jgi:predicted regulator of Ras-like GTPase activity (Roadblock/LC7/MglB family)
MDETALGGLRRVPGVTAAYVVEPGVTLEDGEDAATAQRALLGAMVAALAQAAGDLDIGEFGETIIEAERGAVVAGALPGGRAAVVLAESKANVGMIRMELRRLRRNA